MPESNSGAMNEAWTAEYRLKRNTAALIKPLAGSSASTKRLTGRTRQDTQMADIHLYALDGVGLAIAEDENLIVAEELRGLPLPSPERKGVLSIPVGTPSLVVVKLPE